MYEPEHASKIYLLIFLAFASLVGWAFIKFYRPVIIEAGCSKTASNASVILGKNSDNDLFSYDNVKAKCVEDLKKN